MHDIQSGVCFTPKSVEKNSKHQLWQNDTATTEFLRRPITPMTVTLLIPVSRYPTIADHSIHWVQNQ